MIIQNGWRHSRYPGQALKYSKKECFHPGAWSDAGSGLSFVKFSILWHNFPSNKVCLSKLRSLAECGSDVLKFPGISFELEFLDYFSLRSRNSSLHSFIAFQKSPFPVFANLPFLLYPLKHKRHFNLPESYCFSRQPCFLLEICPALHCMSQNCALTHLFFLFYVLSRYIIL